VLAELYRRPRKLKRARAAQSDARPAIWWDARRPLLGAGDWIERVHVDSAALDTPGRRTLRKLLVWEGEYGRPNALGTGNERTRLVGALRRVHASATMPSPALAVLLDAESERLTRIKGGAKRQAGARQALGRLRRTLYPYQLEGVHRFLECGRLLLADDMGLGKTVQAIAAVHTLWHLRVARRALLIVPASLKSQWLREWEATTDVPAAVVEGTPSERAALYQGTRRGVLIANYELVLRDLDQMHAFAPEVVVLDEAQRIKNWQTKTARFVKTFDVPYRLVLTGTPMENRIDELASVLDWVDEHALAPKWRLASWHAQHDGDATRSGVVGVRHLDTLRARLAGCMIRRRRSEVLGQLPPRTNTRVPVAMTSPQREAHADLDQPIAQLLRIARRRPLSPAQHIRLMQLLTTQRIISNGMAQLEFEQTWPRIQRMRRPSPTTLEGLFSPKLTELRDLIARVVVDQRRKVVIFSQWRRMLRLAHWALQDVLSGVDARAVFFTGAESQKLRTRNVVEFHDEDDVKVLLLTDAGGVGLNLQRAASCCINLDLPWNPAVLEQRVARIHRLGQDQPIDVYNLMSDEGIERRIEGLLGAKQAFFSELFDGHSDSIRFERAGSFLTQLAKTVEPPAPTDTVSIEDDDDAPESAKEVEQLVSAGDESADTDRSASTQAAPTPLPAPAEVRDLFAALTIEPTAAGGVRIEAPPEAAATLGALFEGLGQLLNAAAAPKRRDRSTD